MNLFGLVERKKREIKKLFIGLTKYFLTGSFFYIFSKNSMEVILKKNLVE